MWPCKYLVQEKLTCLKGEASKRTNPSYFKDTDPKKIRKNKQQIKCCQRADKNSKKKSIFTTNVKYLMKQLPLQSLGTKQRRRNLFGSDNRTTRDNM